MFFPPTEHEIDFGTSADSRLGWTQRWVEFRVSLRGNRSRPPRSAPLPTTAVIAQAFIVTSSRLYPLALQYGFQKNRWLSCLLSAPEASLNWQRHLVQQHLERFVY